MITKFQIFEKTYVTHGNGGRPYAVDYDDKHGFVDILKNKFDRFSNVKKIWNGEKSDDNSSVLIEFPNKKYMFVGTEVYEFETDEFITDYYSKIGNSDVPYPVALSKNYVYFLLERVCAKREDFPKDTDWKDCYNYIYDKKVKTSKLKNFKYVEEQNEKINWNIFKRKPKYHDIDPYDEEEWDDNPIVCGSCGQPISTRSQLFIIKGTPIHAYSNCIMNFGKSIQNVFPVSYEKALKILKLK